MFYNKKRNCAKITESPKTILIQYRSSYHDYALYVRKCTYATKLYLPYACSNLCSDIRRSTRVSYTSHTILFNFDE